MVSTAQLSIALFCLFCAAVSAHPSARVVGGDEAKPGQFPHQVGFFLYGSFSCGGSILSPRYILTAAHCVVSGSGIQTYPPSAITVRVGSIKRLEGGVIHTIKRIIVRETYGNFLNDVALLEVTKPIEFNENVQPIELYDKEIPMGKPVIVSGFGRLSQGGALPNTLQYNTLEAIDEKTCQEKIGMGEKCILCLAHKANHGVCNGDSGGPATFENKLCGVAGFVYGGCGTTYPDGYAKVSFHVDWIRKHIQ